MYTYFRFRDAVLAETRVIDKNQTSNIDLFVQMNKVHKTESKDSINPHKDHKTESKDSINPHKDLNRR